MSESVGLLRKSLYSFVGGALYILGNVSAKSEDGRLPDWLEREESMLKMRCWIW